MTGIHLYFPHHRGPGLLLGEVKHVNSKQGPAAETKSKRNLSLIHKNLHVKKHLRECPLQICPALSASPSLTPAVLPC